MLFDFRKREIPIEKPNIFFIFFGKGDIMRNKIRAFLYTLLFRVKHPSIKTKGISLISPMTEMKVFSGGRIETGKRVEIMKGTVFSSVGGTLSIGDHTFFNRNCIAICREMIKIGNHCAFGPNVVIYDHDHRFNHEGFKSDEYSTAPVIIGNNCWIGANTIILRGTIIGNGCVIGAGTILKGNIPPCSLVTSGRELIIRPIE